MPAGPRAGQQRPLKLFTEVGPGFYNLRVPFKMAAGLVDIGNHMSLLRLPSGNFLAIDTAVLTKEAKMLNTRGGLVF